MELVLVMFRAEGERRSFSLPRDMTVIGRREDCDLRIPVSEVSRKHCRVLKEGDEIRVEDLGSSNGTYHNGQRIMGSVAVQAGDSIEVGPVVFVVQVDGVPADDELNPIAAQVAGEASPASDADADFGDLDIAGHGEGAAAGAGTGDSLGNYSVEAGHAHAGGDELSPDELSVEGSHAGSGAPLPMADSNAPTLDLDLDSDHGAEGGHALSEDELLLDLNLKDDNDKH